MTEKLPAFVNLHAHSTASSIVSIDGMSMVDDIAEHAKKTGANAIALTDHGGIFNNVNFWEACKKRDVKPIMGCEFYMVPNVATQKEDSLGRGKSNHITVLARNKAGWTNIIKLTSIANREGHFYHEPRIDFNDLASHKDGLIILSGCPKGVISSAYLSGNISKAEDIAHQFVDAFGDRFYFEVQDAGIREEDLNQAELNEFIRALAKKHDRPTVFTLDSHFPAKADSCAHQYLLGINMGRNIDDVRSGAYSSGDQYYLKTTKEVMKMDCREEEVHEAKRIGDLVEEYEIGIGGKNLPSFELPDDKTAITVLREKALAGWHKYNIGSYPNSQEYADRMKRELSDIEQVGMAEYFLIIEDIVTWAREQGIMIGCGRGSAGGSLTLFLLGITGRNLDPIKWGLVWERFYNVGRESSFPDVDLDFEKERREEVIQYIGDKFGHDRVAQLITFGTMGARSVLKNVMRTYGVPYDEANMITSLIPEKDDDHGTKISIDDSIAKQPKLAEYEIKYPEVFAVARRLEGKWVSYGKHAAAVIINNEQFESGNLPLVRERKEKSLICGWDMDVIDKMGFLKIDALGLNELDIHKRAFELIEERHGIKYDPEDLPLDEKGAFEVLSQGRTEGVFQLGKALGRNWCKRLKPDTVEDISDICALIRPACLDVGMTAKYERIKNGKEEESYIHDDLKPILGPTRSTYIYQEQALKMCAMVGMTLQEADIVRKAIGKKKPELLAQQEARFMELAREKYPEDIAQQLWDYIKEGAGYGFNKCINGDTLVIRASANQHKGYQISVAELWEYFHGSNKRTPTGKKYRNNARGLRILAMRDNRIKIDRVKDVMKTGIKTTYEMKLDTGHSIRATLDHRFYTPNGWKRLSDLKIGDEIHISGSFDKRKYNYNTTDFNNTNRPFKKNIAYYGYGEDNCGYINGNHTKIQSVRQEKIATISVCEECGTESNRYELAHLDGNRHNNSEDNLSLMCVSCHKRHDYKYNNRNRKWDNGYPILTTHVVSIKNPVTEMTYDIEMCGEEHNYIANGIVTHNSHSLAYALTAYTGAFLKAKYPIEFYCAHMAKCKNLGDKQKAFEKISEFINDAKMDEIKVTPPSLKAGNIDFAILNDATIAFGLSHIKGVGAAALKLIKKCSGADNFYEFVKLCFKHRINKKAVQAMILSGAADCFGMPRGQMELEYMTIADLPGKQKEYVVMEINADEGLLPLVERMGDEDTVEDRKIDGIFVPNKPQRQRLRDLCEQLHSESLFSDDMEKNLSYEEEFLGTSLSGSFEDVYSYLPAGKHTCREVRDMADGAKLHLCVRLDEVREHITRETKKRMAFLTVSDSTNILKDVVVFPKTYDQYERLLKAGNIVQMWGWYDKGVKVYKIKTISTGKA